MQTACRSWQPVRLCHGEARESSMSNKGSQPPAYHFSQTPSVTLQKGAVCEHTRQSPSQRQKTSRCMPLQATPPLTEAVPLQDTRCKPAGPSAKPVNGRAPCRNHTNQTDGAAQPGKPSNGAASTSKSSNGSSSTNESSNGIASTSKPSTGSSPTSKPSNGATSRGSKPSLSKTILDPCYTVNQSTNILWHETMTSRPDREALLGQKGCVVWMTGLSGSGKSTLAYTLDHALNKMGRLSYVLDGDNIRHGLCNNLSFCADDRAENNRRVAEVAKLFADCGVITIVSFISPYIKDRENCRQMLGPGEFIEVYLKTSVAVCEKRDPKGLYKKARAGVIKGFTGVDDPYEEPPNPEVILNASSMTPEEMASHLLNYLEAHGMLQPYCK